MLYSCRLHLQPKARPARFASLQQIFSASSLSTFDTICTLLVDCTSRLNMVCYFPSRALKLSTNGLTRCI